MSRAAKRPDKRSAGVCCRMSAWRVRANKVDERHMGETLLAVAGRAALFLSSECGALML